MVMNLRGTLRMVGLRPQIPRLKVQASRMWWWILMMMVIRRCRLYPAWKMTHHLKTKQFLILMTVMMTIINSPNLLKKLNSQQRSKKVASKYLQHPSWGQGNMIFRLHMISIHKLPDSGWPVIRKMEILWLVLKSSRISQPIMQRKLWQWTIIHTQA